MFSAGFKHLRSI